MRDEYVCCSLASLEAESAVLNNLMEYLAEEYSLNRFRPVFIFTERCPPCIYTHICIHM